MQKREGNNLFPFPYSQPVQTHIHIIHKHTHTSFSLFLSSFSLSLSVSVLIRLSERSIRSFPLLPLHACIISLCRCRDYGHVHHGKRVSGTRTRCASLPEHALAWHPLVRHRVLPGFVHSILKGDIAIVSEQPTVPTRLEVGLPLF